MVQLKCIGWSSILHKTPARLLPIVRVTSLPLRPMTLRLLLSRLLLPLLVLLLAASCRNCPILSCHTRKAHMHDGAKYRGQPLWKKQSPAIGEKIKVYNPKAGKHKVDKSKSL